MSIKPVHCYASGRDGDWEAICLDFDIAVQGKSFEEVFQLLNEAIAVYLESVNGLPEQERIRLLRRSAPLAVRLKFLGEAVRWLFGDRHDDRYHHQFTLPVAA
jgi:predicted RNase H-like HicB family nuclease